MDDRGMSSASGAVETVLAGVAGLDWLEETYRDLHAHPELSHEEHRTAAVVAQRLHSLGYDVREGVGGTGVVGLLRNGEGPTVLLRADMDALPVREETGLPYASTVVSDEQGPVMHACGHDVHVACLLGAAALMSGGRQAWSGTLVVLFQPAEETADGARGMVEDGLADIVGDVDVVKGQHVLPMPAGWSARWRARCCRQRTA
jgi:hippurate hydrolase